MSRTYYQIYKEQTFVLARTLIVKHEEVASSMNTELYYRGYVIDSNPYNWRYYLNLSGEYHQADKDELYEKYGTQYMMVKIPSVMGSVEVALTKELLHGSNADKTMMNEYQIGSKFYEELVSRYPEFESLIIGIINPIDIGVALAANNGEILFVAGRYKRIEGSKKWFDTTWYSINELLIEDQEDNLILELQKYIDNFLYQWNNPEYINGNDLYVVTMLGILYANIPNAIFNIRLGNCKTPRAHTFHIRQYLESFGQIGRYVDFIPIGTILWLYKNVHYLEANAGKQKTFDMIMDNMLTPNEIPMSAYTARHELSGMDYDNPLPNSMLYKEVLNFSIVGASDDDRTVLDILEDQKGLARDNDKDLDEKSVNIQSTLNWGGDDRLNTKVLESEMIDIGEPYPFTLSQMLFNMWGYTVAKGYYVGTAYATNPLTGDRLSFSSKSAYILAMYCLNRAVAGVTLENIPKIRLYGIPRTDQPDDYPTDKRFHKKPDIDKMMSWCVSGVTRRLKVLEVRGTHIPTFTAQDSEKFFANVEDIYSERIRKYNTYCDVENLEERGDLELVAKRLYWMNFEETLLEMDYENWFRTIGFDVTQFTDEDLLAIGLELVASATGVSEQDDVRKKWLQKSLLAILKHFVSYSVHVIEKYTDGVVAYLEGQTLRYSNFKWNYIEPLKTNYSISLDYRLAILAKHAMRVDLSNILENSKVVVDTSTRVPLDLSGFGYEQKRHTLKIGTYALGATIFNVELNTEKTEPVFIIVIDEFVNSIRVGSVVGNTKDDNFIYTMRPDLSYLKPYDIHAAIKDLKAMAAHADIEDAVIVGSVDGGLQDANQDTASDTQPHEALLPHGLFASTKDSAITDIGFTDSDTTVVVDLVGNINTSAPDITRSVDHVQAGITNIAGGLQDASQTHAVADNSSVGIGTLGLGFMDPAIPDIITMPDSHLVDLGAIVGNSNDIGTDIYGDSPNTILLNNINIEVIEETIDPINLVDVSGLAIGGISAIVIDSIDVQTHTDKSAVMTLPVTMSIVDDVLVDTIVVDNSVVGVGGIYATVQDSAEALYADASQVVINNVVGDIIDGKVDIKPTLDAGVISIGSMSASYNDNLTVNTVIDVSAVNVGSITMDHFDYPMAAPEVIDVSAVVIGDILIEVQDDTSITGITTQNTLMVANIAGNIAEDIVELKYTDNQFVGISGQLLDGEDLNDDFITTLSDENTHQIKPAMISSTVKDSKVNNVTTDNEALRIGRMSLSIRGQDISVDTMSKDVVQIKPESIGVRLTDYMFVQMPSDNQQINVTAMSATLSDVNVVLDNVTASNTVKVQSSKISINVKDSDTMLDAATKDIVAISGIQMNVIQESDDSKPKP